MKMKCFSSLFPKRKCCRTNERKKRRKENVCEKRKKEKEKFQGKAAPIMSKIEISNIVYVQYYMNILYCFEWLLIFLFSPFSLSF